MATSRKSFASFNSSNSNQINKESKMNSIRTIDCTNPATIDVNVYLWESLLKDTQGEPSLMHIIPSTAPADAKFTIMNFKMRNTARQLRAAVGAAEALMTALAVKTAKAVIEEGVDTGFTVEDLVKVVSPDGRYHFPMIGGFAEGRIQLIDSFNPHLGDGYLGAVDMSVYRTSERTLNWIVGVKYANGKVEVKQQELDKIADSGYCELRMRDGVMYFRSMDTRGVGMDDSRDYRLSFHRIMACIANGEKIALDCGSYIDRDTHKSSNYVSSKAEQLRDRAVMTADEIRQHKIDIATRAQERRSERQAWSINNQAGKFEQPVVRQDVDENTGEVKGAPKKIYSGVISIVIDEQEVSFTNVAKIAGVYNLHHGKMGRDGKVSAGRFIRTIEITEDFNRSDIENWAAMGRVLMSVEGNGQRRPRI